MSSIREVAKLAGVSPATVSRVMNGTANVVPEKRERVLAAIAQTDFVPNEVARTLFKKSSKTIGLIIPSIRNPYFTQLADFLDALAEQNGYRLSLYNVGRDPEKQRAAIQMLVAANADGVIYAAETDVLHEPLKSCPIPVVALDTRLSGEYAQACIYADYYQGARLAVEHLLDCGCKSIVCIKGPQQVYSARCRYEAYRDVCCERELAEQTVTCEYDFGEGLAVTETLLEKFPEVDGILACNDIVAISAYKVLHQRKIAVPQQIQLVGFDDIDLSTLMSPELTTVRQPLREMAEKAMEQLIRRDNETEMKKEFMFPVVLIQRETTKRRGTEQ